MVRVVIRKPFHSYLQSIAASLGIDDLGEVVNMIVLEHMRGLSTTLPSQSQPKSSQSADYSDEISGLL